MSESIIINQPIRQTTVVIDTDVNTIYPVANFIKQLSSNFEKFLNVSKWIHYKYQILEIGKMCTNM